MPCPYGIIRRRRFLKVDHDPLPAPLLRLRPTVISSSHSRSILHVEKDFSAGGDAGDASRSRRVEIRKKTSRGDCEKNGTNHRTGSGAVCSVISSRGRGRGPTSIKG